MIDLSRTRPLALALAAAAVSLTAFGPVQAAEQQQQHKSVAVMYRDLDLTTAAGQKTLEHRLDLAARNVCGMDVQVTGTRVPDRNSAACYKETRAQLAQQFANIVDDHRRGA